MKQFLWGVLTAWLVVAIGIIGYLRLGFTEIRADLPSSRFETYFMRAALYASVRREAPEIRNPMELTDESLIRGGKIT
jgi:hypothetical protein